MSGLRRVGFPSLGLLLVLAACGGDEAVPERVGSSDAGGRHGELACVACHQGDVADRGEPSVPGETCTSSGCHGGSVPAEVSLSTVTFRHRSHGARSEITVGCAGCHTHRAGGEPLSGGTEACGLCHAESLSGGESQECTTCHDQPQHVTLTSQGIPIPHQGLPWVSRSCVRCHYDVSQPRREVSIARCASCHRDQAATAAAAVGEDLHPRHSGLGCIACHEEGSHRIVAMSSAVELRCGDCHQSAHGVPVIAEGVAETCRGCHREVHQAEQRLFLGSVGHDIRPAPSEKFMDGLVCRSCHLAGSRGPDSGGQPATTAAGCVSCHEPRYARILAWWDEGTDQRLRVVRRYLERGRAAVGGGEAADSVAAFLAEAGELVALVEEGHGEHNLRLSHRLLEESLERTRRAWAAVGTPPDFPSLGRQPSMGLCSYCHYRLDDPWEFGEMPEDFHRRVMGR